MEKIEYYISTRRNYYRKRRNLIRRLFLVLVVVCYLFVGYKIFLISKEPLPKVEIIGSFLIQDKYIIDRVVQQISNKNFFLISPKKISNDLAQSFLLLKDVVIRKYLIPEPRLIVFLKEKSIWARLVIELPHNINKNMLISNDGDLLSEEYLNLTQIPKNLLPIYVNDANLLQKSHLCILKKVFDILEKDFNLRIKNFLITNTFDLEIYPQSSFKIKAGKIDTDLFKRISMLKEVMKAINEKSYLIEYLDLTLESGAIFRKYIEEKKRFGLFRGNKL